MDEETRRAMPDHLAIEPIDLPICGACGIFAAHYWASDSSSQDDTIELRYPLCRGCAERAKLTIYDLTTWVKRQVLARTIREEQGWECPARS